MTGHNLFTVNLVVDTKHASFSRLSAADQCTIFSLIFIGHRSRRLKISADSYQTETSATSNLPSAR